MPPTDSHRVVRSFVLGYVQPLLIARGFRGRLPTWRREVGVVIQVVHVHFNKWNVPEQGSFTLELGVHHPAVDQFRLEAPSSKQAGIGDCICHTRLSHLRPDSSDPDRWWTITPDAAVQPILQDIVDLWDHEAEPWLAKGRDLEWVGRELEKSRAFVRAATVQLTLGRPTEAMALVANHLRGGPVPESLRAWLLRCDIVPRDGRSAS